MQGSNSSNNIIDIEFFPQEDFRSLCIETNPCQHNIIITFENGEKKEVCWVVDEIYKKLVELGKPVPMHISTEFKINQKQD